MPERSPIWIACAIGIGLLAPMLGGCRAHPSPAVSNPVVTATVAAPIGMVSQVSERAEERFRVSEGEAITSNLDKGELEEAAGRPDQAARYYQRILRENPKHDEAHQRLARLANESGDHRQAERHLRAALESRPGSAVLWTELARCCAAQNRLEDARGALRKARDSSRGEISVANLAMLPVNDSPAINSIGRVVLVPRGGSSSIIRTARVEPPASSNRRVRLPSQIEVAHTGDLPFLPSTVIRRNRESAPAPPRGIHLATLETVGNTHDFSPSSPESNDLVPRGNLPLWGQPDP